MFKKIMAVTAVCAIAATTMTSAFAAVPVELKQSETGSLDFSDKYTGATDTEQHQYTVMVFKTAVDITNEELVKSTAPAATDIYYINQGTAPADLLGEMLVKATDGENKLPKGNYIVRIGSDADIDVENLVLTVTEDEAEGTKVTFFWGDINLDGFVDAGDIAAISQSSIGGQITFVDDATNVSFTIEDNSNGVLWGDINLDGYVDAGDIAAISQSSIGGQITFENYTIEQEVTITIPNAQ